MEQSSEGALRNAVGAEGAVRRRRPAPPFRRRRKTLVDAEGVLPAAGIEAATAAVAEGDLRPEGRPFDRRSKTLVGSEGAPCWRHRSGDSRLARRASRPKGRSSLPKATISWPGLALRPLRRTEPPEGPRNALRWAHLPLESLLGIQ